MNEICEHKTVEFPVDYGLLGDCKFSSQQFAAACDMYSQQGWELISTFSLGWGQDGATRKVVAVFRRRMENPPPLPKTKVIRPKKAGSE